MCVSPLLKGKIRYAVSEKYRYTSTDTPTLGVTAQSVRQHCLTATQHSVTSSQWWRMTLNWSQTCHMSHELTHQYSPQTTTLCQWVETSVWFGCSNSSEKQYEQYRERILLHKQIYWQLLVVLTSTNFCWQDRQFSLRRTAREAKVCIYMHMPLDTIPGTEILNQLR